MFGFIPINKPQGPTSFDIVARVRRLLPRKTKVGHAGTLDPFATGVLVICVGKATRLAEYVQRTSKRYRAEITLGKVSDTDDIEGNIADFSEKPTVQPYELAIREILARFTGQIMQTPPAHSAVHVDGQRAYSLARKGVEFEIAPKPVMVHEIELVSYDWPVLTLNVHCGCGTYIRSLARDIGSSLGVGGYCSALERTAVGEFDINSAIGLDMLTAENIAGKISAPNGAIGLEIMTISAEEIERVCVGKVINSADGLIGPEIALVNEAGNLIAIAKMCNERILHPAKVFLQQ